MPREDYDFTMTIRVYDPEQLLAAALAHPDAEGMKREDFIRHGEIDIGYCLIMVVDPGSIDGCEILGSDAQQIETFEFEDDREGGDEPAPA